MYDEMMARERAKQQQIDEEEENQVAYCLDFVAI